MKFVMNLPYLTSSITQKAKKIFPAKDLMASREERLTHFSCGS